jgi:hypothetical protein
MISHDPNGVGESDSDKKVPHRTPVRRFGRGGLNVLNEFSPELMTLLPFR